MEYISQQNSPKNQQSQNLLQSASTSQFLSSKTSFMFNPKTTRKNVKLLNQDLQQAFSMKNLPSRYDVLNRVEHLTYNQKNVLGTIQNEINELEKKFESIADFQNSEDIKMVQPKHFRIKKPSDTKQKPIKKEQFDYQNFKEIFVQPKEKILSGLKNKEEQYMPQISAEQKYEKAIDIYKKEEEQQNNKPQVIENDKNLTKNFSLINQTSLKQDIMIKQGEITQSGFFINQTVQQNFDNTEGRNNQEPYFFDQMIQVQPPDQPNATVASPMTPGNGYAPSIPLTYELNEKKANIKDLLVRAKAGMQAGDVQKEAHLAYYLGMVYEQQKSYAESVKYYKKYYTCAKMMEDKIGLALASNRIAINYFYCNDIEKSIDFHVINLQLSDIENTFAAYYNLGICNRKIGQFGQAISFFAKALDWAKIREELESECISYGQMGITYNLMKQFEEALEQFMNCYDLANKLNNNKLQLDCLMNITKITSCTEIKETENAVRGIKYDYIHKVLKDAIKFAKGLEDQKTSSICYCNLGVIEGKQLFQVKQQTMKSMFEPEFMDEEEYIKQQELIQIQEYKQNELQQQQYIEHQKQLQMQLEQEKN